MLNWIREFWVEHKSKIIPGLIVAIVSGLVVPALLSQRFRYLVIKGLDKVQVKVTLPFYWLPIIFALGILVIRWLIWKANKKFKFYLMDEVKGLIWEWNDFQAFTGESPPYNLTPLCPLCWAELPITDTTHNYQCVSCGFKKDYKLTHKELIEVVKIVTFPPKTVPVAIGVPA